jgi:hypothetical protein
VTATWVVAVSRVSKSVLGFHGEARKTIGPGAGLSLLFCLQSGVRLSPNPTKNMSFKISWRARGTNFYFTCGSNFGWVGGVVVGFELRALQFLSQCSVA